MRRAKLDITMEVLHRLLDVPDDIEIVNIVFEPDRNIVRLHLRSPLFPDTGEGWECYNLAGFMLGDGNKIDWEDNVNHLNEKVALAS